MTDHARKTVKDYAGIASIIAALGGVLGLWIDSRSHVGEEDALNKSVLALIEYRLGQVEQRCGIPPPPPPMMGSSMPSRELDLQPMRRPSTKPAPPSFDDLRQLAREGRTWSAE